MKNPFDRLSPRQIRILYTVFALGVLAMCIINFADIMVLKVRTNDQCAWLPIDDRPDRLLITDIVPDGVADRAGLRNLDWLLAIDGVPVMSVRDPNMLINRHATGEHAVYRVERDGRSFETKIEIIKLIEFPYIGFFLLGFGFLVVGLFVVYLKPEGRLQRQFGRYGILSMFYFGLVTVSLDPAVDPPWKIALIGYGFLLSRVLAPPVFVHFFLRFPARRRVADRKWLLPALYAGALLCSAPLLYQVFISSMIPLRLVGYGLTALHGFYIAGLVIFAHSYFGRIPKEERPPLRPIVQAVLIGVAAVLYLLILSTVHPFAPYFDPELLIPVVLMAGVPPAFGYAIIRSRLMDIGFVVKRSIIYGIITAAIVGVYVLVVFGFGSIVGFIIGREENQILAVLAFLVIAFLFDPVKRRVQEWVDRIFYQERYNYQRALLEFSSELPSMMNLEQILELIVSRISSTMHIEKVAVVICEDSTGCGVVTRGFDEDALPLEKKDSGLPAHFLATRAAQSFALRAEELDALPLPASETRALVDAGVMLSVPLLMQDRLIGVIHVGVKKSGKLYSQEDADLLATVAGKAAIAIENARLHLSEIEKQKMEHQLLLARRIQEGLLPKSRPLIDGLDITGISLPAQSVGGDYFDFIPVNGTQMLVAIGDVSGKGMPAALYMSKVQGMIQLAAQMHGSPREILTQVNRRMVDGMEKNSFITMLLALFDPETRTVRICRAGHTLPLLSHNGEARYINADGIGMGLEKGELFDSQLQELELRYEPGAVFVLYSDGLTEMMNSARQEFGEDRLRAHVRAAPSSDATTLQDSIVAEAMRFKGEAMQHDDMTLVVVKTA